MSLLLLAPNRNMKIWEKALLDIDFNIDVEIWPEVEQKDKVHFAVCWNQPEKVLNQYPNLKAVSSLGAGADHLLSDPSLPHDVPVCRVVSASLVRQMKEYVHMAVLNIQRNMVRYIRQSDSGNWQAHNHIMANQWHIGMMGLGELGKPVARHLARQGYRISGWARTPQEIDEVATYAGSEALDEFLSQTQILVCMLPLTSNTQDILNLDLFKKLKQPAWMVNVARGEHLVDEDLIYAIDKGYLKGAWLDVFAEEPLSDRHPFWSRPNIMITPHIASITQPAEAAEQIVDNYKRILSGMELVNGVDRQKGY